MIRTRTMSSLQLVKSPRVRDKAIELLDSPGQLDVALVLLCANYVADDAETILTRLPNSAYEFDDEYIHAICCRILDLFADERASDAPAGFHWIYENSPCSICREGALRVLDELNAIPDWMREECRYDCNDDIRQMSSRTD